VLRTAVFLGAFAFLLTALPGGTGPGAFTTERATIPVVYFGDVACDHCDTIVDGVIPELETRYEVDFEVTAFDVLQRRWEQEAREQLEALGLSYRTPPILFIGNNAYQGNYAIEHHLPREVEYLLQNDRFRSFDLVASNTSILDKIEAEEGATSPGDPRVLRYFWGVGCPHCERARPVIDRLEREFPDLIVERYEVFETREHHDTFLETLQHYGSTSTGVPQIFFEDYGWIGFSEGAEQQIEDAVRGRMVNQEIELPLFGVLSAETTPAAFITMAIAFVDGFNPCSLWVLTMLLGLVAHTRSRRRILLVGTIFLLITAAIYGAFMLGLLNIFAITGTTLFLRIVVAVIAVSMGLVNIKDYFAFKQGLSLTIPARFQRRITAGSRAMATTSASTVGLITMTALFAAGIALVELPCTAGFPVIWSRYVTSSVAAGTAFVSLLALYLLVYLAIEVVILAVALVTMGRISFSDRQARPIKLIGGAIMISLGIYYVIEPEMAETLTGVGRIFLTALFGAAALALAGKLLSSTIRLTRGQRRLLRKQQDPAGR
jgi:glutaredoxin